MGLPRPRLLTAREAVRSYGVATAFLLLVTAGLIVSDALSPGRLAALQLWASTNVTNLHHHPVPALVLSAFLPSEDTLAWIPLVALAMFGANRAIGNLRLALVCAAGHVVGTLVSEGIVDYRVDTGRLPPSWAHIIDIGPSYVLVAAIVVAVLLGSIPAKVAALADFAVLVFLGHIFADLTRLHVAPVGHLTAMVTAALLDGSPHAPPPGARPCRHGPDGEPSLSP